MKSKYKILMIGLLLTLMACSSYAQASDSTLKAKQTKVLLFKWKENVCAESKEKFMHLFERLSNAEIGFYELIVKDIDSSQFDIALILNFQSRINLERYKNYAIHQEIVKLGPMLVDDFLELQY